MKHIEMTRSARRFSSRPQRRWPGVSLVIVVNLVLLTAIVLMAEGRLAKIEHRIETLPRQDAWRGELATTRSELGEETAELRTAVTGLRGDMAKLRREAGADDAALRGGLDALGERLVRIEGMVATLWRLPADGTRLGATS